MISIGDIHMTPTRMSKIESAIRVVLTFNEAFNRHDVAALMQITSDDCVIENFVPAPDGSKFTGIDEVTQFWQTFFTTAPQAHIEIEEIFGFGERCIMRWKLHPLDNAENKKYVRGVDIFRVRNNMICEKFSYIKG
jgi:limonene-1,2-epoxide hydrolase